jgi:hypothetical protein
MDLEQADAQKACWPLPHTVRVRHANRESSGTAASATRDGTDIGEVAEADRGDRDIASRSHTAITEVPRYLIGTRAVSQSSWLLPSFPPGPLPSRRRSSTAE